METTRIGWTKTADRTYSDGRRSVRWSHELGYADSADPDLMDWQAHAGGKTRYNLSLEEAFEYVELGGELPDSVKARDKARADEIKAAKKAKAAERRRRMAKARRMAKRALAEIEAEEAHANESEQSDLFDAPAETVEKVDAAGDFPTSPELAAATRKLRAATRKRERALEAQITAQVRMKAGLEDTDGAKLIALDKALKTAARAEDRARAAWNSAYAAA